MRSYEDILSSRMQTRCRRTEDLSAFEMLEREVKREFPGHIVRWAFTDKTAIKRIREDRIIYFTQRADGREPVDIVSALRTEGYNKVLLQPLLLLPSEEMQSLERLDYPEMKVVLGEPVIHSTLDVEPMVRALNSEIAPGVTTIIMAPGDVANQSHETLLVNFADSIEAAHKEVFVLSAEGRPGERRLGEAKEHARNTGRVHIIPFEFMQREEGVSLEAFQTQEAWKELVALPRTTFGEPMVRERDVLAIFMRKIGRGIQ